MRTPTIATSTRKSAATWSLSIRERIERGEGSAIRPARRPLEESRVHGHGPRARCTGSAASRWFDAMLLLFQEMRIGLRSSCVIRGLAIHRDRDARAGDRGQRCDLQCRSRRAPAPARKSGMLDRLIYIRQSAPGIGTETLTCPMPEIGDLESRVNSISAFGDFSTVDFTLVGFGREPSRRDGRRGQRIFLRGYGEASPGARAG